MAVHEKTVGLSLLKRILRVLEVPRGKSGA